MLRSAEDEQRRRPISLCLLPGLHQERRQLRDGALRCRRERVRHRGAPLLSKSSRGLHQHPGRLPVRLLSGWLLRRWLHLLSGRSVQCKQWRLLTFASSQLLQSPKWKGGLRAMSAGISRRWYVGLFVCFFAVNLFATRRCFHFRNNVYSAGWRHLLFKQWWLLTAGEMCRQHGHLCHLPRLPLSAGNHRVWHWAEWLCPGDGRQQFDVLRQPTLSKWRHMHSLSGRSVLLLSPKL